MKIKIGDTVKVITGKDKGKEGKVIRTLKSKNKVVVEGLNILKKHSKPTTTNDKGGIFNIEAPIHVSNVKFVTKEEKKSKEKLEKKEKPEKKEKTTKQDTKKASK